MAWLDLLGLGEFFCVLVLWRLHCTIRIRILARQRDIMHGVWLRFILVGAVLGSKQASERALTSLRRKKKN